MASKLPHEIWIDREALVRPALCSHISKTNEFEPGVRMYVADQVDRERFVTMILWAIGSALGQFLMRWLGVL